MKQAMILLNNNNNNNNQKHYCLAKSKQNDRSMSLQRRINKIKDSIFERIETRKDFSNFEKEITFVSHFAIHSLTPLLSLTRSHQLKQYFSSSA